MFEGQSLWQIFNSGGFTMYILLSCSVISIGVILERLLAYYTRTINKIKFMERIKVEMDKGEVDKAIRVCDTFAYAPVATVVRSGLKKAGRDGKEISSAMEREIMVETVRLEQYTSVVGTIGNIAVYIGLFGTVLGIVRSFHNISQVGSGGISVVIGGVSEALVCTATGLLVAIPAVVAYNYFMRRVDDFVTDMEYCASETADLLSTKETV